MQMVTALASTFNHINFQKSNLRERRIFYVSNDERSTLARLAPEAFAARLLSARLWH